MPNMLSKQFRKKNVNVCEGRKGETGIGGGRREGRREGKENEL